jgi:hypothetical protein
MQSRVAASLATAIGLGEEMVVSSLQVAFLVRLPRLCIQFISPTSFLPPPPPPSHTHTLSHLSPSQMPIPYPQEYEDRAVLLATSPHLYHHLRVSLHERRMASKLFDTKHFVGRLEKGKATYANA